MGLIDKIKQKFKEGNERIKQEKEVSRKHKTEVKQAYRQAKAKEDIGFAKQRAGLESKQKLKRLQERFNQQATLRSQRFKRTTTLQSRPTSNIGLSQPKSSFKFSEPKSNR